MSQFMQFDIRIKLEIGRKHLWRWLDLIIVCFFWPEWIRVIKISFLYLRIESELEVLNFCQTLIIADKDESIKKLAIYGSIMILKMLEKRIDQKDPVEIISSILKSLVAKPLGIN